MPDSLNADHSISSDSTDSEVTKKVTVAAVQMNSCDDPDQNFERASKLAFKAKQDGASLIVFPENFLCFGSKNIPSLSARMSEFQKKLGDLASQLGTNLIAGSLPIDGDKGRYFSSSLAIGSNGGILARYDKIHLFDVDVEDSVGSYRESDTYVAGNKPVVATVSGLSIGLSICYDLRFPELYQHYMKAGVDAVVIPSAFTYKTGKAHWSILLRARAIESQSFVVAPNQCGLHGKGRETWGHSMIINPWGEVLAECGSAEGYCVAELDLSSLLSVRTKMPVLQHKRLI